MLFKYELKRTPDETMIETKGKDFVKENLNTWFWKGYLFRSTQYVKKN